MTLESDGGSTDSGIFPLLEVFFNNKIYAPKIGTALDIGSDFGQNSKYLANKGYTVDAIHDSWLMQTTRKYHPKIDFIVSEISADKFSTAAKNLPTKQYDIIINPYLMVRKNKDFSTELIVSAIEHLKKEGYLLFELFSSDTSKGGDSYKNVRWAPNELQEVLAKRISGVDILQEKIRTSMMRSGGENKFLDVVIQKVV